MNLHLRTFFLAIILIIMGAASSHSQKQIELLNRGLFVLNKGDGTAYLSWRLLVRDDNSIGFNVYRSTSGGAANKINSSVHTATTDYIDSSVDMSQSNSYYVVPVLNGVEQQSSELFTLPAYPAVRQYMPISLQAISGKNFTDYNVLHVYPGDIDGDGDYDYIVKRFPVDASYNTILLDCYDNEGVFKWRIDLGPNVETYISSMTAPVLVADFDSDGKAEIIAKTGESTVFGNGYTIPDTDGDGVTDYNGHMGSGSYANVMAGPEFLSYIDGETGAEIDRDNFLSRRDPYSDWGDTYGARMNFMMSSVGYFDGVHPGCVFSRGDGGDMDIDAWQVENNNLVRIWDYTARGKTYAVGGWTDFHQIQCIDVDGDGKDEISWGACMLDNDGTLLYTTKYVHGDRFQITDIDPNRPGLETFIVQQYHPDKIGSALYDTQTGQTIKDWFVGSVGDIGRGDAGDIDPNSPGLELFDTGTASLHSATGSEVTGTSPYPWVGIWWDGDLLRENLIGVGSGGYNPAINNWDYNNNSEYRMFSIYNDGGSYAVTQPYGGRVPFVGDIFGDWREEIALESSNRAELRIYTTKISANDRIYTLMQNPAYRVSVTSKGYLCTKYPDYFLGANMATPPTPNVVVLGEDPGVITGSAIGNDGTVDISWTSSQISGNFEILRDTDSNPSGRSRIGVVGNWVNSYTDTNVTNGTTYYYWIKSVDNFGNTVNSDVITATPSQGIISGETYVISARHSGLALDVAGRSTTPGANVLTWSYGGGTNQQWIVTDLGTGYYSLKPAYATALGLDVYNVSSANGANINVWSYWGGTGQQFDLSTLGDGYYNIIARNSGLCLDVENASTANGANVQQWGCSGGTHQQFIFELVSLKSATIDNNSAISESVIDASLSVYPNPNASGKLIVKAGIQDGDVLQITIHSTSGQTVLSRIFDNDDSTVFESTLDISALSSGVYIVTLKSGSIIKSEKLIVR